MTPAEQILSESKKLEMIITEMLTEFERRTGAIVGRLWLMDFVRGEYRRSNEPLTVRVEVNLPETPPLSR